MRSTLLAGSVGAAIFLVFSPEAAEANAGFPTLMAVWPLTLLLFPVAVALEAYLIKRSLALPSWPVKPALTANLWSTFLGPPIVTLLMFGLAIVTFFMAGIAKSGLESVGVESPYVSGLLFMLPMMAALPAYTEPTYFGPITPAMALILHMIPAFYVSVSIETWRLKKRIVDAEPALLSAAVRKANMASYGGIMVMLFTLLIGTALK